MLDKALHLQNCSGTRHSVDRGPCLHKGGRGVMVAATGGVQQRPKRATFTECTWTVGPEQCIVSILRPVASYRAGMSPRRETCPPM